MSTLSVDKRINTILQQVQSSLKATSLPLKDRERVAASPGQTGLYLLSNMLGSISTINVPILYRIKGSFDVRKATNALGELARKHKLLASRFEFDGETLYLTTHSRNSHVDIHQMSVTSEQLNSCVDKLSSHEFDIASEPCFKVSYIQCKSERYLHFVFSHLIVDAISVSLFMNEFLANYAGKAAQDTAEDWGYFEYSKTANDKFEQGLSEHYHDYWKAKLSNGLSPLLDPCPDRLDGSRVLDIEISEQDYLCLEAYAQQQGVSLKSTLLSCYALAIGKAFHRQEFLIGISNPGRYQLEHQGTIGYFVNTVPHKFDLRSSASWAQHLSQVDNELINTLEYSDTPFYWLVNQFAQERTAAHHPLVQVEYSFNNQQIEAYCDGVLTLEQVTLKNIESKNSVCLAVLDTQRSLKLAFFADNTKVSDRTLELIREGVVETLKAEVGLQLHQLSEHTRPVAGVCYGTASETPSGNAVLAALERSVESYPNKVAIIDGNTRLTFSEVNQRANQIARYLEGQSTPETTTVLIDVEAHKDKFCALLAVWKLSLQYVPVSQHTDKSAVLNQYPHAIVFDLSCVLLLEEVASTALDFQLPRNQNVASLAYTIFTSGTTGRPKGVEIALTSVNNFVTLARGLNVADRQVASNFLDFAFDGWLWSTLVPFINGVSVKFVNPATMTQQTLEEIDFLNCTPSILSMVKECHPDYYPHTLVIGGEKCPKGLLDHYQPHTRVINSYGPTETTICSHIADAGEGADVQQLGDPITNAYHVVLDDGLQLVRTGDYGTLYIGGEGVAQSYLSQPGLTASKFIPDPFHRGQRLYNTGDKVSVDELGNIRFIGRMDKQVKIRGFRVELSHIDNLIKKTFSCIDCTTVVLQSNTGDPVIATLVCSELERDVILEELRQYLPEYYVPGLLMTTNQPLPINQNGKIDQEKVRFMFDKDQTDCSEGDDDGLAAMESQVLANIWYELTLIHVTHADTSLFEYGGHSLALTKFVSLAQKHFGVKISIRHFLKKPTINTMRQLITGEDS